MDARTEEKLQGRASAASSLQDVGQSAEVEASKADTESEITSNVVVTGKAQPDDSSILFGRGKAYNSHPGNLKMRSILDKYRDTYKLSLKGEKCKLVRRVYDELIGEGMKFMKQAEGGNGWVEVDCAAAVQKVGLSLRNPKIRQKPTGNKSGDSLVPEKAASSARVNALKGQTAGFKLKEGSIATDMQQHTAKSPYMESGLNHGDLAEQRTDEFAEYNAAILQHLTGGLLQNLSDLVQPRNTGFTEHNVALLQNHLAEMELERLRSTLSASMGPLAHSGHQQSFHSANQVYTGAERDLLVSLASANSHFDSEPEDDPQFWIRLAAASMLNSSSQ